MASFYSFEMGTCCYCGKSGQLIQLPSDITCSYCGAEQKMGNIVSDSINVYKDEFAYAVKRTKCVVIRDPKYKPVPDNIFNVFSSSVPVPDCIIDAAKEMYAAYLLLQSIKNDSNVQTYFTMACIYYSSRLFSPITKKQLLNNIPIDCEHDFTKACQQVRLILSPQRKYRDCFFILSSHDIAHFVNSILSRVACLTAAEKQKIKPTVFKLNTKIGMASELATLPQVTVASTLIYMSIRAHKISATLKTYSHECDVTSATILKTHRKIQDALLSL
jgi:hypothetical protein